MSVLAWIVFFICCTAAGVVAVAFLVSMSLDALDGDTTARTNLVFLGLLVFCIAFVWSASVVLT